MSGPAVAVTGFQPPESNLRDRKICAACRTRIRESPEGTRAVLVVVEIVRLMPDQRALREPEAGFVIQFFHRPCWEAAIAHFNKEVADGFRT